MRKRVTTFLFVIFAIALMAPAVLASTIVTENNVGVDWNTTIADDGTVAFVDTYGAPAGFGNGALELVTGPNTSSRAQLNSAQDAGMLLADIDDVSFHTFVSTDSTGSALHAPMINIAIYSTGTDGFTTLVFEPIYTHGNDAIVRGEWQEWDASGEALWWSTRDINGVCGSGGCFVSFDDIKAANPDAVILGYAMNLGTSNPNITAAVDGFTMGSKTFDFEPAPTAPPVPEAKADCTQDGWEAHGFKNQGQCVKFVNTGNDSR